MLKEKKRREISKFRVDAITAGSPRIISLTLLDSRERKNFWAKKSLKSETFSRSLNHNTRV